MEALQAVAISCPYCGERVVLLVDCSVSEQAYVEDCQVCCRPMAIEVAAGGDGTLSLAAVRDDEA
jgi:hypothetical protein